ncbi:uncharacterized protein K02A2.6-like isoform X1 [Anopheles stephensi]|uniref:uncharacterized protein K02A2.6-like isoform X1 n=1 Tax=Anopheles stephensi TaxID=30069 RepID=UPI0016589912|nr:uncharacterized protein K02A2.6-like isoform X1 [Anopheles stephensi]XP_035910641.1 uncharacterized protein K02A2.6-like isoform X1 [Anopheles stephensi]XP_035910649.1 uncharacterized protein K02A2.6-like isoform X1 [Anopheles stephensi]XP_035910659.1 uncharacterized protein K02A2.6-like isoform X1 [Anopheles stephensi]
MLSEASQEICTINTHKGLYRYTRMPFGISSAPTIFQSIIHQILLNTAGIAYIDDILVGGITEKACKANLYVVLEKLNQHNVKLNLDKSEILRSKIDYLGYTLSAEGIQPNRDKLEAIDKVSPPKSVPELEAYLGLLNYYHLFLPNLSSKLHSLYTLLRKESKFIWSSDCQEAFEESKKLLMSNQVLEPYDPTKPLLLPVDASPYGVRAVLSHKIGNVERPVAFASATLSEAQKNYAQVHREALTVVFGVEKFHKYLFGYRFTVITDNSGLKEIFNPCRGTSCIEMARLQRWELKLADYEYVIEHRPGKYMANVDAMSRLPLAVQPKIESVSIGINAIEESKLMGSVDQKVILLEKQKDIILRQIMENTLNGWPSKSDETMKYYEKMHVHFCLDNGILYFDDRVVIPKKLKTRRGMDQDIKDLVQTCVICQARQTVPKEVVTTTWKPVCEPFERVHVDLCYIEGRILLILVDAFTKYIDVKIVNMTRATDIIEQLESFFAHFGLPKEVVSDNGPPFNSEVFVNFLKQLGVKVTKTPPYHPQSNGLAERAVRTVKEVLQKFTIDDHLRSLSLGRKINRFLLQYRNEPCTVTQVTPSYLIFKYVPTTRYKSINPLKSSIHHQPTPRANKSHLLNAEKTLPVIEFKPGEKAFYRNHFKELMRWIPVIVYQKLSGLRYLIDLGGRIHRRA